MSGSPHISEIIARKEVSVALDTSKGSGASLQRNDGEEFAQLPLKVVNSPTTGPSPISKLVVDILSLVFEECSRSDWRAPITIGLVCNFWRDILLKTPRCWAYVPIQHQKSVEGVKLWLQRCHGVPLHVRLPPYLPSTPYMVEMVDMVMNFSESLECMVATTHELPVYHLFDHNFPILRKLSVVQMLHCIEDSISSDQSRSLLDIRRFPLLRALSLRGHINPTISAITRGGELPALDHLQLFFVGEMNPSSFDLIKAVSFNLVFLEVFGRMGHLQSNSYGQIRIPSLKHLKLCGHLEVFNFEILAPHLKIYQDLREPSGKQVLSDTKCVIDYTNGSCLSLMLSSFPSVEILRVDADADNHLDFLKVLADTKLCPQLREIEFLGRDTLSEATQNQQNEALKLLNERHIKMTSSTSTIHTLRMKPWYPCPVTTCGR